MVLEGTGALVAGGGSGLGEATARTLAAAGARVAIADLNEDNARRVAGELDGIATTADVTVEEQVQTAVDAAVGAFGEIRLAVSCAGIGWAQRVVTKEGAAPLGPFDQVVRVNLIGTYNVLRMAAAAMASNEPDEGGERG